MFRSHLPRLFAVSLIVWLSGAAGGLGRDGAAAAAKASIYPMWLPATGSLDMVTRVDLKESLRLAGNNLMANLDPKQHYLPNFHARPIGDGTVAIDVGWANHNLGRWWDAMMRLQAAIGYAIPPEAEAAMKENLFHFFNNPDHLCLAPFDMPGVNPHFDAHSLREGLLGLNALVQFRKSEEAAREGHAMIESLLRLTGDDGSWRLEKSAYARRIGLQAAQGDWGLAVGPPGNHGRLIEALVWFYQTTGDPLALRAAERFARFHLAHTTRPDGGLAEGAGGHTHSYLGTLRGLLLYGELTGQHEYIDTVAATYRKTVRTRLKRSGFISHNMDKDFKGETTSPGDAVQLALWLATRHGYDEFFDDVERIVRARLLPCQITATPGLKRAEMAPLLLGGYGGMHTDVHGGKMATFDITAAVVHSLVDVYRHIAAQDGPTLKINFHFDYDGPQVRIVSTRARSAMLTIVPKQRVNVLIRIPRWTPRPSVTLAVGGRPVELRMLGDYTLVPRDLLPGTIERAMRCRFPPTRADQQRRLRHHLRGDEIMGISPNNDFYPFYPNNPE